MDCCGHEGPGGDARFDFRRVADGVHVAVAAPAYKVNSNTAIIESDDGAAYQHYRPWRHGLLANIERTYPMVS